MSMVLYSTDDLSIDNLKHFKYWDYVKESNPKLKVIAFAVAENLICQEFITWYENHKDWVEIGVHCYNHEKPQEGWREDQEQWILKARNILLPYLPKRYLYRPPGFRFLPKTELILKKLGFSGIAHQQFVKYFDTCEKFAVINTHCTEKEFLNPIGKIWGNINVR